MHVTLRVHARGQGEHSRISLFYVCISDGHVLKKEFAFGVNDQKKCTRERAILPAPHLKPHLPEEEPEGRKLSTAGLDAAPHLLLKCESKCAPPRRCPRFFIPGDGRLVHKTVLSELSPDFS